MTDYLPISCSLLTGRYQPAGKGEPEETELWYLRSRRCHDGGGDRFLCSVPVGITGRLYFFTVGFILHIRQKQQQKKRQANKKKKSFLSFWGYTNGRYYFGQRSASKDSTADASFVSSFWWLFPWGFGTEHRIKEIQISDSHNPTTQ